MHRLLRATAQLVGVGGDTTEEEALADAEDLITLYTTDAYDPTTLPELAKVVKALALIMQTRS